MLFSFLFIAQFPNAVEKARRIDPYSTLGLKKNANIQDINRAYKRFIEFKKTVENPSFSLQKQIDDIEYSYSLISNNSTRALYDRYGYKIFSVNNFSIYNYYSDNQIGYIRSSSPTRSMEAKRNGGVVIFPVLFTLKDFVRGHKKEVNILRTIPCKCSNGGIRCRKCRLSPVMSQYQKYELFLPKGSSPLQRIYAINISDTPKDRSATDVVFVAYEKPNKRFKREGYNIYSNITVDLSDTFSTKDFRFKNVDDRIINISLSNVRNKQVITINGKGVPLPQVKGKFGDLILTVHVKFPKKLSEEQKKNIERILPDDESAYE